MKWRLCEVWSMNGFVMENQLSTIKCWDLKYFQLHSEYRSTYRWHEYTPKQTLVRQPQPQPQPIQHTATGNHSSSSSSSSSSSWWIVSLSELCHTICWIPFRLKPTKILLPLLLRVSYNSSLISLQTLSSQEVGRSVPMLPTSAMSFLMWELPKL